jgi:undecaprenyl-diphosphatase
VRRLWTELAILLSAGLAILFGVGEFKDAFERPRPEGGLVDASGFAYPSGHAAHSVIYAWLAIIGALRLRPGWSGGTALITGGLLLAAAVGLSRVYLGVHYWSDVAGGWGLGVSLFAIAAIVAVVVVHLRHNRGREA